MAYDVVILESAQREMRQIVHYLAKILKSTQAASAFMNEFDRQVALIRSNPNIFAVSLSPELAAKDYHTAHINNYIMLYTVRDGIIYIAHIFHQTQDYARLV